MEQRITGTETVKIIGELELSGNLIPRNWYRKIKLASGKPNLTAITILSEIVYWYRPAKDGENCPKFAEDLWQCSYAYLEEEFGFSRKQILTAFAALEELGLVYREFRTIYVRGRALNNVMYIGINPESLESLCEERKEEGVSTLKERGIDTEEESVSSPKVVPITSKVQTNTETITNNSTEISNIDFSSNQPSAVGDGGMASIEEIKERIEYESLKTKYSSDALKTSLLEELISAIEGVLESDLGTYSISKIRVERNTVVAVFGELTRHNMEYVVGYLADRKVNATNRKAYLVALLYNAVKNGNTGWHSPKRSDIHNFEQREIDYEELERILLTS